MRCTQCFNASYRRVGRAKKLFSGKVGNQGMTSRYRKCKKLAVHIFNRDTTDESFSCKYLILIRLL